MLTFIKGTIKIQFLRAKHTFLSSDQIKFSLEIAIRFFKVISENLETHQHIYFAVDVLYSHHLAA